MADAVARTLRGISGALRARPGVFALVAVAVFVLDLFLPPAVLSLVRKPADFFTFNPWLRELPGYLAATDVMLQRKLEFIPHLALFWFSADSPYGGVDWGFAVTVADLMRYLVISLLFGTYFALVFYCRDRAPGAGWNPKLIRGGGRIRDRGECSGCNDRRLYRGRLWRSSAANRRPRVRWPLERSCSPPCRAIARGNGLCLYSGNPGHPLPGVAHRNAGAGPASSRQSNVHGSLNLAPDRLC